MYDESDAEKIPHRGKMTEASPITLLKMNLLLVVFILKSVTTFLENDSVQNRYDGRAQPHLHLRSRLDESLVSHGLGAVPAVFSATAGLDGQERTLLNLCRVEEHAVNRRSPV